jgi:predicted ATP-grasp superfamily ATP-dependent carboligase
LDAGSQPRVFLSATLWWPTSARLALSFVERGFRVASICPPGHPLRTVTGIETPHRYSGFDSLNSLRSALHAAQPDLVIPCDDGALWQLYELYRTSEEFRTMIERSLGSAAAYPILRSRLRLLQAASQLGIRVPRTIAIDSGEELADSSLPWPAVLKADGTWGGEGVAIVANRAEAARAFARLTGPRKAFTALSRFLIKRHPLALWLFRQSNGSRVVLQSFVPGRQATIMFACWQGEVLASVTAEVLSTQRPMGSASIIRLLRHEEIAGVARMLARKFMLSGLHGIDFVLEEENGAAYLIEMNPRATQLGHLNVLPEGNLVNALATKLGNAPPIGNAGANRIGNQSIALFPQAWKANPPSPLLRDAYHDIPREQPALVAELSRDPWPERRLLSRVFSGMRTRRPPAAFPAEDQAGTEATSS